MDTAARFRPWPACCCLFFLCVSLCCSVAHAAEPGPELESPLPEPRRMPAGPSVQAPAPREEPAPMPREAPAPREEPAPPPRELIGPIGPTPPAMLPQPPREEAAPMPREQTPSPPQLLLPSMARPAAPDEALRLHQEIEGLRMEREAMLLEEIDLITARDVKAGKGDQEAQLRRHITELLMRAAQQSKRPRPTEKGAVAPQRPADSRSESVPREASDPPIHSSRPKPAPVTPPAPKTPPTPVAQSSQHADRSSKVLTEAPVDPLSLAQSLFLTGDHAAALSAYRKLEQDEQKPDERVAIQYMIACCLRKLGKLDEAAGVYREVANSGGSDILVENAQWYLRAMKDRRELETQLEELRQRRQALMPRKP